MTADLQSDSPTLPLYLGCPVWNCDAWAGEIYPAKTPRAKWLAWYSRMFNTVEGNSSFYAIPSVDQAKRWVRESAPGFHFCMKFPREISHERGLVRAEEPTSRFLDALYVLAAGDRLGPSFLQLGPDFGPSRANDLEKYLDSLPSDLSWAVEVRHLDWFDSGANEARLNEMLAVRNIDRALFDSRPLYQSPPDDEVERVSQTRKPKSPLRTTVTGQRPMLRIVGRNRIELVQDFVCEWAPVVFDWIQQGLRPYIFTHAPDDQFAPGFARMFWDSVVALLPPPRLSLPRPPKPPEQLGFQFE